LRPLVRLADQLGDHAVHGRADDAAYRRLADGSGGNASLHRGNGKSSGRVRTRRRTH